MSRHPGAIAAHLSADQVKRYMDGKEMSTCPRCESNAQQKISEELVFTRIADGHAFIAFECPTCGLHFDNVAALTGIADDSVHYKNEFISLLDMDKQRELKLLSLSEYRKHHGRKCPVCKQMTVCIDDRETESIIGHTFFIHYFCGDHTCGASWDVYFKSERVEVRGVFHPAQKHATISVDLESIRGTSDAPVGPKRAKKQSKACRDFLKERGHTVKLSECQEMVAQAVHGSRNWSTLLGAPPVNSTPEKEDDRPRNMQRADWADEALRHFGGLVGMDVETDGYETMIKDLMVDLLHLAAREEIEADLTGGAEHTFNDEAGDWEDSGFAKWKEEGCLLKDVEVHLPCLIDPEDAVGLPIISDDGVVKVEWVNLNEGVIDGEYCADDPEDENVLRFDVAVKECRRTENMRLEDTSSDGWMAPPDSSFCTQVPANTPPKQLVRLLVKILEEVDGSIGEKGASIKRICERLSWMDADGNY